MNIIHATLTQTHMCPGVFGGSMTVCVTKLNFLIKLNHMLPCPPTCLRGEEEPDHGTRLPKKTRVPQFSKKEYAIDLQRTHKIEESCASTTFDIT